MKADDPTWPLISSGPRAICRVVKTWNSGGGMLELPQSVPRLVDRAQALPLAEVDLAPTAADLDERLAGHFRRGLQASVLPTGDIETDGQPPGHHQADHPPPLLR